MERIPKITTFGPNSAVCVLGEAVIEGELYRPLVFGVSDSKLTYSYTAERDMLVSVSYLNGTISNLRIISNKPLENVESKTPLYYDKEKLI